MRCTTTFELGRSRYGVNIVMRDNLSLLLRLQCDDLQRLIANIKKAHAISRITRGKTSIGGLRKFLNGPTLGIDIDVRRTDARISPLPHLKAAEEVVTQAAWIFDVVALRNANL